MSGFVGATGLTEYEERFDEIESRFGTDEAYASGLSTLVGLPDPIHTTVYGINVFNPGLFGLVERAETNIGLNSVVKTGLYLQVNQLDVKIDGVVEDVVALETKIDGVIEDVVALDTKVDGVIEDVVALDTKVDGVIEDVVVLETKIDGVIEDVVVLEGVVEGLVENVATLDVAVGGLETAVGFIQNFELPAIGTSIIAAAGVATDAEIKASKALGIWNTGSGTTDNNVYHLKSGNVGIGLSSGSVLTNKLEVNGDINIPIGSQFKIGDVPLATQYVLPIASTTVLGGVIPDGVTITINPSTGIISGANTYSLPTASTTVLGGVKIDGSSIQFNESGQIYAPANIPYSLPTASTTVLGGVRIDDSTITINGGIISAFDRNYNSLTNKIQAGTNISITGDNFINSTITGSTTQNIIGLTNNLLRITDKSSSMITDITSIDMTTLDEPVSTPFPTSVERMYPPIRNVSSFNHTISGQSYGNGLYTISSSTSFAHGGLYQTFNCFNESDMIGGAWADASIYNTSTGLYNGSSFIVSGYNGDWLRIQLPVAINLLRIGFKQRPDTLGRAPRDFRIYGSNNGTTWVQLVSTVGATYTNLNYSQTNLNLNALYNHFALVVNRIIGGISSDYMLNFDEWYIFGSEILPLAIEGNPITHKTLNFTHSTTQTNTFALSVQPGTVVQINNGAQQLLSGNYTVNVGATQSSVVVGLGNIGLDPFPLANGTTIAIKYSMTRQISQEIFFKKDGLIKYVAGNQSDTNTRNTGNWQIMDLDTQPLTQFSGNLPTSRIDGNLAISRIDGQIPTTKLDGNLNISRIDGQIPTSKLDGNFDWSRIASQPVLSALTGQLDYSRIDGFGTGVNDRFVRQVSSVANNNFIGIGNGWQNLFQIDTNLHLNTYYNTAGQMFQYYISLQPNTVLNRNEFWFGMVRFTWKDGYAKDFSTNVLWTSNAGDWVFSHSSSDGVFWLDIVFWADTEAVYSLNVILH